ncbi:hypothetical protein PAHAL_8G109200 [Panicum hallii]|uniref:Uncharacterized protein n=1 Tax=Panicum hallii TaxID=206008 RepID=A0A2T8I8E9_9POAL|nr:hypothetical protein PAHAL_8G109200 [Panicum hallii]
MSTNSVFGCHAARRDTDPAVPAVRRAAARPTSAASRVGASWALAAWEPSPGRPRGRALPGRPRGGAAWPPARPPRLDARGAVRCLDARVGAPPGRPRGRRASTPVGPSRLDARGRRAWLARGRRRGRQLVGASGRMERSTGEIQRWERREPGGWRG